VTLDHGSGTATGRRETAAAAPTAQVSNIIVILEVLHEGSNCCVRRGTHLDDLAQSSVQAPDVKGNLVDLVQGAGVAGTERVEELLQEMNEIMALIHQDRWVAKTWGRIPPILFTLFHRPNPIK